MPREKEFYRERLSVLRESGVPPVMTKTEAAKVLGISVSKLYRLIAAGYIETKGTSITDGALAKYLC